MTREVFLSSQWKPYPALDRALLKDPRWVCGTLEGIKPSTILLQSESVSRPVRLETTVHASLGVNIPWDYLRRGDVIAYDCQTQLCFLLSPCLGEKKVHFHGEWQNYLEVVRSFFIHKGFKHIWTPTLLPSSGIDAHIDFFQARGVRTGATYYLPTSPEFALKKALVSGERKVFEIKPCFRDDDLSPTHRPEFMMIEWYRAYADKWELFSDFLELVDFIRIQMNLSGEKKQISEKTSIADLFLKYTAVSLTPHTSLEDLKKALARKQKDFSDSDDWDDLFFRLYIDFIEPHLGCNGPQAVYDFPFSQGSLARQTTEGWADRFEIYWNGIELANAYQEQNDPSLMQQRYFDEVAKRKELGRVPHEVDHDFLNAMKQGLPPSAGIALGLDRLWMVLNSQQSIHLFS